MKDSYDVIVVGGGVVGASIAFHLSKLGSGRFALVERGELCAGGTARSCAICRTHYSIRSNTELAVSSLEMFKNFQEELEDPEADSGFVNSGYLILAPPGAVAEALGKNLEQQAEAGANTEQISALETIERHPWLRIGDDVAAIGFEPESGYADPYLTTSSFARAARNLGVDVRTHLSVQRILLRGSKVVGVRTEDGDIAAGVVVSAVGPWTQPLIADTGLRLPLEVSRHSVLTFRVSEPYEPELPVVKDLTTENKMYFRPSSGNVVLVGSGDHGDPIGDADQMDENVGMAFVELQGAQLASRMPPFEHAELTASWVGPYDVTPDWNPVLGPAGDIDGLHLAFGFSGHGFKLAPAVGRALAQTVLGQPTDIEIGCYGLSRFEAGELLAGSYGIGSIS